MVETGGLTMATAAGANENMTKMSQGPSEEEDAVVPNTTPALGPPPSGTDVNTGSEYQDSNEAGHEDEEVFDEDTDCLCYWDGTYCELCDYMPPDPHCHEYTYAGRVFDPADFEDCRCKACRAELDIAVNYGWCTVLDGISDVRDSHESSYMTLGAEHGLRYPNRSLYDRSTSQELQAFIRQRELQDPWPGKLMLKWYYIRLLEKADQEPRFDFLGLPTDLRLEIYRHLLTSDSGTERHTAIIRTCKLVHGEASDVLYGNVVAKCEFAVVAGLFQSAKVLGKQGQSKNDYCGLPHCTKSFPPHLLRMHRLEIHLTYGWVPGEVMDAFLPLNAYLINLASFLMDNHSLKRVTIILHIDSRMEEWGYGSILYPLLRLRNIRKVQFRGEIPDKYRVRLIEAMQSSEPAYNTLRQMRVLLDEALEQIRVTDRLVSLEDECRCGTCPITATHTFRLERLRSLRRSVRDSKIEGFLCSSLEQNLQAKLGMLKDILRETSLQKLEGNLKTAEAMRCKKRATKNYISVLEKAMRKWKGHIDDEGMKYAGESEDWPDID